MTDWQYNREHKGTSEKFHGRSLSAPVDSMDKIITVSALRNKTPQTRSPLPILIACLNAYRSAWPQNLFDRGKQKGLQLYHHLPTSSNQTHPSIRLADHKLNTKNVVSKMCCVCLQNQVAEPGSSVPRPLLKK